MMTTVAMPSVTHAMKGQRLLQKAGYHCDIEKSKEPGGCIYRLLVAAPSRQALLVLEKNSLPFLSISEG